MRNGIKNVERLSLTDEIYIKKKLAFANVNISKWVIKKKKLTES